MSPMPAPFTPMRRGALAAWGGAVAMMALVAYNAMQFGLIGLLGGVSAGVFASSASMLAWWVWSLIAIAAGRHPGLPAGRSVGQGADRAGGAGISDRPDRRFRHPGRWRGRGRALRSTSLTSRRLQLWLADGGGAVLPGVVHRDRGDDDLWRRGARPGQDHSARDLSVGLDDRRVLCLHHLADDRRNGG